MSNNVFPYETTESTPYSRYVKVHTELNKRELFAVELMQGIINTCIANIHSSQEEMENDLQLASKIAVKGADILLQELKNKETC